MKRNKTRKLKLESVTDLDFLDSYDVVRHLDNLSLAKSIRNARLGKNITQGEAALKSTIEQSHLSNLEQGQHSISYHKLACFCRGIGANIGEITEESTYEFLRLVDSADCLIFKDENGFYHFK